MQKKRITSIREKGKHLKEIQAIDVITLYGSDKGKER